MLIKKERVVMNTFDSLRLLSMRGLFYILLLSGAIFNIYAFDCDNDRDCRGFGGDYFCNNSYQCELGGADEFYGKESSSSSKLQRKLDLN